MPEVDLPEETFSVRPWKGSDEWFMVHIADTLPKMRKALREFTDGDCKPTQLAAVVGVMPNDDEARELLGGLLGVLFFARTRLGAGLVAHELAHAAFLTCNHLGVRVEHWIPHGYTLSSQPTMWEASGEEKYCNFLEHLSRDFWRQAYAKRIVA